MVMTQQEQNRRRIMQMAYDMRRNFHNVSQDLFAFRDSVAVVLGQLGDGVSGLGDQIGGLPEETSPVAQISAVLLIYVLGLVVTFLGFVFLSWISEKVYDFGVREINFVFFN